MLNLACELLICIKKGFATPNLFSEYDKDLKSLASGNVIALESINDFLMINAHTNRTNNSPKI